jgi:hypothetical protein
MPEKVVKDKVLVYIVRDGGACWSSAVTIQPPPSRSNQSALTPPGRYPR